MAVRPRLSSPAARAPAAARAAWLVIATVAMVACTNGAGSAASTTTTSTQPVGPVSETPIGVIVHVDGFDVRVDSLSLATVASGRIDATALTAVSNSGETDVFLTPVTLAWPGDSRPAIADDTGPDVAGGTTVEHRITFTSIPWTTPPAGAELVFGSAPQHQARVPLDGSDSSPLTPTTTVVDDGADAGNLGVTVSTVTVRFDDPLTHTTLPTEQVLVRVDLAARLIGEGAPNLLGRHVRLRIGDQLVGVREDGWSAPNLILSRDAQPTVARFDVPVAALDRRLSLVVEGPFDDGLEIARAEIPLPIPS